MHITHFSIVGYSLGGLISRYLLALASSNLCDHVLIELQDSGQGGIFRVYPTYELYDPRHSAYWIGIVSDCRIEPFEDLGTEVVLANWGTVLLPRQVVGAREASACCDGGPWYSLSFGVSWV